MYNGSCNQIPSKSSLTSLEDTSPSLRNVRSISLDLAAAALASELSIHPMITDQFTNFLLYQQTMNIVSRYSSRMLLTTCILLVV